MRVAIVTSPWFADHSLEMVRHLSRVAEVDLYLEMTPDSWGSGVLSADLSDVAPGLHDAMSLLDGRIEPQLLALIRLARSATVVAHRQSSLHPSSLRLSAAALGRIRESGADVIHSDDVSLRLAFAVATMRHAPLCANIHDPRPHSGEGGWRTSLRRAVAYPRVSLFVLRSEFTYRQMRDELGWPEKKLFFVPIGPLDLFREVQESVPLPAAARPRVLFFGRMSPYKGIDTLIGAAPLVCERVPRVDFVLAGQPITGWAIPQLPPLPNGGRFVVLPRHIAIHEMGDLFGQAAVVACPYRDATQSGVVLTAYAFRRPVVVSDAGALPEYVQNGRTGSIVPVGDPEALARSLAGYLIDPERLCHAQEAISALCNGELSWTRIVERHMEAYGSVLRDVSGVSIGATA